MNKLEKAKFSKVELEREIIKNSDDLLEYCDVCFIALASQEKRTYRAKKPIHLDCAKTILPK